MIKNISTRVKLLIFPLMFIVIVVISAVVYTYFNNLQNSRNQISMQTEEFVEELLKGRIAVYQFLRVPNDETANKVRDDFSILEKRVEETKPKLTTEQNKRDK